MCYIYILHRLSAKLMFNFDCDNVLFGSRGTFFCGCSFTATHMWLCGRPPPAQKHAPKRNTVRVTTKRNNWLVMNITGMGW